LTALRIFYTGDENPKTRLLKSISGLWHKM